MAPPRRWRHREATPPRAFPGAPGLAAHAYSDVLRPRAGFHSTSRAWAEARGGRCEGLVCRSAKPGGKGRQGGPTPPPRANASSGGLLTAAAAMNSPVEPRARQALKKKPPERTPEVSSFRPLASRRASRKHRCGAGPGTLGYSLGPQHLLAGCPGRSQLQSRDACSSLALQATARAAFLPAPGLPATSDFLLTVSSQGPFAPRDAAKMCVSLG